MNPIDFDLTVRLCQIQNKHAGQTIWLPPSFRVRNRTVPMLHWFEFFGFKSSRKGVNYWDIPKDS
jgi:hypothetical protein